MNEREYRDSNLNCSTTVRLRIKSLYGPTDKNADILLTASEISSHDLEKLKLKFPILCSICQPVFIGALDHADKAERFIDHSHIQEDFTEILVFQQESETFGSYAKTLDKRHVKISVRK